MGISKRKCMIFDFSLSVTKKWFKGIVKLYFSGMGMLKLLKGFCYFRRRNRVLYKATIRPGVSTLWQGFYWVAESYALYLPPSLSPSIHHLTFSTFACSNTALLSFPVSFLSSFFSTLFPFPLTMVNISSYFSKGHHALATLIMFFIGGKFCGKVSGMPKATQEIKREADLKPKSIWQQCVLKHKTLHAPVSVTELRVVVIVRGKMLPISDLTLLLRCWCCKKKNIWEVQIKNVRMPFPLKAIH